MMNDEPASAMPSVVVYGDFNCPFSAVASARVDRLVAEGIIQLEWQAVEHDSSISVDGEPVTEDVREGFADELEQIRGLLGEQESVALSVPSRRINTHEAVAAYAAATPDERPALRRAFYEAYWSDDVDLGNGEELDRLGAAGRDEATAEQWHSEWDELSGGMVPSMTLADGYHSKGLGALDRLAAALNGDPERLRRR